MKKISLLGAHFKSGNMGVGALLMGAITCIKHAWPDAEISLLEYDDRSKTFECRINDTVVTVGMIALRFSKKFYLHNNIAFLLVLSIVLRLLPFQDVKRRIVNGNSCLNHLHGADMVLSIAGGDSFSDLYGMGRFFYIALPLLLTITMKKKLVHVPQTIGPFKNFFAGRIAAFIMKHSTLVYARDNESLVVARRLMGASNATKARFCYDMGFVLNPVKPAVNALEGVTADNRKKPIVGLNISGLLCVGGYNHHNMFGLNVDYAELIRSLICHLIVEKKTKVLLVPHVFGAVEESDASAANRFFNELTGRFGADLHLVRGNYDQNEIKYIIGQCDFFIGSRMHACIAALSQSVPAIGIAYSRKFAGVMQSIGVENLIVDPRRNSKTEILELIGGALDSRENWTPLLRERMPHIKSAVLNLLNEKPKSVDPLFFLTKNGFRRSYPNF
jgi:colanic acid/amylovoran biosynthesis protein